MAAPTVSAMRVSPTCREPPDLAACCACAKRHGLSHRETTCSPRGSITCGDGGHASSPASMLGTDSETIVRKLARKREKRHRAPSAHFRCVGLSSPRRHAHEFAVCRLGIIAALSTQPVGARSLWALVSESDGDTRLSFPSTDRGREVFQPNAAAGGLSLPAHRLRSPRPAGRWSSPAPPPCSSRRSPTLHVNVTLFYADTHHAYRVITLGFDRNASAGPAGSIFGVYCRLPTIR